MYGERRDGVKLGERSQPEGAGKSRVMGFMGDHGALTGWAWSGRPHLRPDSGLGAWAAETLRARGLGAVCSSVLASEGSKMPLSPRFCPQPRFWLQWPCALGTSLRPVPRPAHPQVEAATPPCRLVEKVRLQDWAW